MRPRAASLVCLLALALAGCGTTDREHDAGAVAQRFHAALEAGDGPAACAQLNEETASKLESQEKKPCEEAILSLDLPKSATVVDSRVYVTSAFTTLAEGGSDFLDVYENSLVLVMGTFWLGTWLAQSLTGAAQYNAEQLDHRAPPRPASTRHARELAVRVPGNWVDGDPRSRIRSAGGATSAARTSGRTPPPEWRDENAVGALMSTPSNRRAKHINP